MEKEKLIGYLNKKYEALEFWESLRHVVPSEEKIKLLKKEIEVAKKKMTNIRQTQTCVKRLSA